MPSERDTDVTIGIDEEKAKAYLAADNRTSDRAKYDSEQLLSLLEGLEDLDGTKWGPR